MLEIYYGFGKGKTCICLGAAVKAAVRERKVLYVNFLADGDLNTKAFDMMFTVTTMTAPVDINVAVEESKDNTAQASKVFRELFDSAVRTVLTQKYDMLILDGVFDVLEKEFLIESEVYEFLSNAPDSIEIVCTGISINEKFVALADHVTMLTDTTPNESDPN